MSCVIYAWHHITNGYDNEIKECYDVAMKDGHNNHIANGYDVD